MDIIKRFERYIKIETTSNEFSNTYPSSDKELVLLNLLKDELTEMGLEATYKNGFTYGKLKSDCGKKDTLFLMAHVDTAPDASGKDVNPSIVHFDGSPITLKNGKVLDPKVFPSLAIHKGHDLMVTDGNTLLGADDKAGDALIMDLLERLIERGNYPNIVVAFSPDEEIGRGTEGIDVDFIKKDIEGKLIAYTVDGGQINKFSQENFNAAQAVVELFGTSVHPSIGKGVLVNAQELAVEFHKQLPEFEKPEYSADREPFVLLTGMEGGIEKATLRYILRSFDLSHLAEQKQYFKDIEAKMNEKYNSVRVKVTIRDQYFNMKEIIDKYPDATLIAKEAYKELGIEFIDDPIRGGTDGAMLSYKGIPCPNLPTGGDNFHGVYEYLDLYEFNQMRELLTKIADLLK